MAKITASRFNTLHQAVENVLGLGTDGYGQAMTSSIINTGDIINASHINSIYEDLRKCYKHQNGGNPASSVIQEVQQGDLIKDNDGVNYTGWDQYEQLASDNAGALRNTVALGQYQDATGLTRSRGSWNGTIVQVFDINFSSALARRYFFNSGGRIIIRSATTDSSSLGNSWQNMFNNNAGDISLTKNSTLQTGSGGSVSSLLGNDNLTTSYQYIYQNFDAGGGAYSANDYYIEAQAPSDIQIKIRQTWRDEKGGNPDENIADLTATCIHRTAAVDVIGTAPGVQSGSGTTL